MNDNRTVKSTSREASNTKGFIPSIDVNSDGYDGRHTEVLQKGAQKVSLSQLTSQRREGGEREVVNINDIMPETIKNDNESKPGVDVKESPQAEILKPGGIFDKYVEEKRKEMLERISKEQENGRWDKQGNAIEDSNNKEEKDDQENIDKEELDILKDDDYSDSIEEYNIKEVVNENDITTTDEVLDEETTKLDESENDNAVPFFATMGRHYDFVYLDNYNDLELPRDESETVETESNNDDVVLKTEVDIPDVEFVSDEEDDLESLEKNDNDNTNKRFMELRAEITAKIKPKCKTLSISGYTIANKATSSNKILEMKTASAGKWPLINTGICIQVREISGQKIEYMRGKDKENLASVAKKRLRTIYDHVISPKPNTFEAWLKSIAYDDYDHVFMPVYLAAFDQSNYMPATCISEKGKIPGKTTGCGKMFMSDNIDIMDCVKFKDDAAKKKFWDLYKSDRYDSEGLYVSEVIPISNTFAIAFKNPSLYDILFEPTSYNVEFMDKYDNIIGFMPYIDNIYWMDHANHKLVKVDYKRYDNNASKTAKSKVIRYSKVFDTFKTDEYATVQSIIASIGESRNDIEYIIPEMTCIECGRTIKSEPSSAQDLLFTRHRLGVLANSSIN